MLSVPCCLLQGSQDSLAGAVATVRVQWVDNQYLVPGTCRTFMSSLKHLGCIWGACRLLQVPWDLSPRVKQLRHEPDHSPPLMPKCTGAAPPLLHVPSWCAQRLFYLYIVYYKHFTIVHRFSSFYAWGRAPCIILQWGSNHHLQCCQWTQSSKTFSLLTWYFSHINTLKTHT
jgi:hypothetical protein